MDRDGPRRGHRHRLGRLQESRRASPRTCRSSGSSRSSGSWAACWPCSASLALRRGRASCFPRAGGNYVFLREGYGRWPASCGAGSSSGSSAPPRIAALATVFTESLHDILQAPPGIDLAARLLGAGRGVTVGVILGWPGQRARRALGRRLAVCSSPSSRWLRCLASWLLPFLRCSALPAPTPADTANFQPLWPRRLGRDRRPGHLLTAFLGVLWAYHGWMNIAPVADEVREPQRNLPLALLGRTSDGHRPVPRRQLGLLLDDAWQPDVDAPEA